jgi:hypothetical protein
MYTQQFMYRGMYVKDIFITMPLKRIDNFSSNITEYYSVLPKIFIFTYLDPFRYIHIVHNLIQGSLVCIGTYRYLEKKNFFKKTFWQR